MKAKLGSQIGKLGYDSVAFIGNDVVGYFTNVVGQTFDGKTLGKIRPCLKTYVFTWRGNRGYEAPTVKAISLTVALMIFFSHFRRDIVGLKCHRRIERYVKIPKKELRRHAHA